MRSGGQRAARTNVANQTNMQTNRNRLVWWTGRYAAERVQFGRPLAELARVQRKLGRMVTLVMAARQLTFFSARMKDSDKRCDLEAGMAKLLATRAAWECADANVQIHGGNGFAEEYTASRLLVDARVLSIFEGANEIQAHVVARRLLET